MHNPNPNPNPSLVFTRGSLPQNIPGEAIFATGFAFGMLTAGAVVLKNNQYNPINEMPSILIMILQILIGQEVAARLPLNGTFLERNLTFRERQTLTAGAYSGTATGIYLFSAYFAEQNRARAEARPRHTM